MEEDDPFFFITDLCQVSDSQEKLLRSCPFAFQSEEAHDGSGECSLEPTGVLTMSPPESHKECISVGTAPPDNNDVFHTPPEGSSVSISQEMKQSVTVDLRRNRAIGEEGNEEGLDTVDLERGTNLGFSLEAELTERTGISSEEESSLNRPRLSEGKIEHRKTKNLGYADKYKGNHPCQESGLLQNPETDETLLEMNGGKIECCKESSTMRKIEFSTKLLDSFKICEADGGCNGSRQDVSREKQNREAISNTSEEGSAKKRMDDIDKFRYVPSTGALCCESKKDAKQKRALPASVCGKENEENMKWRVIVFGALEFQ
ncbi:hypothetical protein K2173_002805 [Erythroxylum novogranatense]|uniref:Uncharacterized protein n=1 Tax=Erythroxylum novogranatense TaxID=1862640 RepID=A0AAV8SQS8_9ROSI|nr:hypothetical protein K2173_002805 [Erythroxylum novogranatense]